MRVSIGTFARWCIEDRFGSDLEATVRAALCHYVERLETSSDQPLPVPRFACDRSASGPTVELDLPIAHGLRRALEAEAREQGLPVESLLTHAIFVYIADLDAADQAGTRPWIGTFASSPCRAGDRAQIRSRAGGRGSQEHRRRSADVDVALRQPRR